MAHVISLLTDFGLVDSYVAEVKAVLLSSRPRPVVVDITHEVPPFQVEAGAFQLLRAYSYFPKGTFHLAVVDPGVGTSRKCLYVRTRDFHFVGPDNGVLLWAIRAAERIEKKRAVAFEIPVPEGTLPTFNGRDVFAPFLAKFSAGRIAKLKKAHELVGREFPAVESRGSERRGEVIGVDRFGNVVTSIPFEGMKSPRAKLGNGDLGEVASYDAIAPGKAALIRGSHGFWEIASKRGSAAELLGLKSGDPISISTR